MSEEAVALAVFEYATDALFLLDTDAATILAVNRYLCLAVGYPASELVGASITLLLPDSQPNVSDTGMHRLRSGQGLFVEQPVLGKHGRKLVAEVGLVQLPDGRILGIARDITERKQAERALRSLTDALQHAVEGIARVDEWGRYTSVNTAYAAMAGRRPEDLVGKSWTEPVHPDDLPQLAAAYAHMQLAGKVTTRARGIRRDGSVYHQEGVMVAVVEEGRFTGHYCFVKDITSEIEAELALKASEAKFARTFHASPSPKAIVRDPDGVIVEVNAAFLQVVGYSRDELVGRTALELGIWPSAEERNRVMAPLATGLPVRDVEARFRGKDGREIIGLLSMEPISLGGVPHRLALVRDVTEQRSLEAQLRQSQKMEAIGQLTGGIAHDLNNVLTVIRANAEIVAAELPATERGDALWTRVAALQAAAENGAAVVGKLLAFGRRSTLRIRPTDLQTVVRGTLELLRPVLPSTIEVSTAIPEGLPPVAVDPAALEQILVNLATNARDAMPAGGRLVIGAGRRRFRNGNGTESDRDGVFLSMADTGTGMDRETLQRAFEPFFTTKEEGRGTGLGLAMVHGLVKQHQGRVALESTPGRGTRVDIDLPAWSGAAEAAPPPVPEGPPPTRPGRGTILVVEDNPALREIAELVLARAGYRVLAAESGEAALRVLEGSGTEVTLVVSDVVMPGIGGAGLRDRLRQQFPGIRMLFMSGYPRHTAAGDRPLDPDVALLQKPWSPSQLLEAVNRALDDRVGQ